MATSAVKAATTLGEDRVGAVDTMVVVQVASTVTMGQVVQVVVEVVILTPD
jgi:hypothetical protein